MFNASLRIVKMEKIKKWNCQKESLHSLASVIPNKLLKSDT